MSDVKSVGGGAGLSGDITDPVSPPENGDRLLSDPPAPLAPGERFLGGPPAPLAPGERYITDPPAVPDPGDRFLGEAPTRAPGERYITDPPAPGDGFITDPPTRGPGERFLSDPPAPLAEGERYLGAPGVEGPPPAPRPDPTAGDYAVSSLRNLGNVVEDLWDKKYGDAATNAGQAVMDAGSAAYELLFGDDKKADPK